MEEFPKVNFNCLEIHLLSNKTGNEEYFDIYDINFTEAQFLNIMSKLKETTFKFFQKEYKEYVHKELEAQYQDDGLKVTQYNLLACKENDQGRYISLYLNKQKLTPMNFPSTTDFQKISYVRKLIFRINNRIYINFLTTLDTKTDKTSYSIFINYNHDENVDVHNMKKTINECINLLLA
jgi:hypothetical protein